MTGRRRLARALTASLLAVAGSVTVGVGARPAGAFPGPTVDLVGHGYGHGRGMGQFGSLGYAVTHGWDYRRILDHYYGGTRLETRPFGDITVHLTKFDGIDVIVQQKETRLSFSTGNENVAGPFRALLARHRGGNRYDVLVGTDCSGGPGGWQPLRSNVPGPITLTTANPASNERSDMLQVCELDGTRRWLRGRVIAQERTDQNSRITASRAVNQLNLEAYLKGVVPRESPASWGSLAGGRGMHALRAQAVAARSYAMAEDRHDWARTCDTQSCQVYGGHAAEDAAGKTTDLEQASTNQAVDETAGQVRVFSSDGRVARTEFSSSTGGYSAGGVFPAVPDEGDAIESNPGRNWTAKIPVSVLEGAHPGIGTLLSVDVTRRNGLGDMGGRVVEVVLRGSKGRATLSGAELRGLWPYSGARPEGLRSDWFRVVNNPSGGLSGYWVVASDGGIFSFGEARFHGSTGGLRLNSPILGLAATRTGDGYWLVAADGGIFSFGDARFFGSTGALKLNRPVVGMAATTAGQGYWLVASDGGIFSFGDARFFGSTGALTLNKPVVGMAPTPSGNGYWLVASDGGIFAFGDARFFGSTGAMRLNKPVVGMAPTPTGNGYWLLAADGGLFSFGDAGYHGSLPGSGITTPAVAMRPTRTGGGYLIATAAGGVVSYGDAPALGGVTDAMPGYRGGAVGLDVKAAPIPPSNSQSVR